MDSALKRVNRGWSGRVDGPRDGGVMWPGHCRWGDRAVREMFASSALRSGRALVVTDTGVWGAIGAALDADRAAAGLAAWCVYDGVVPNPSLAQVREAVALARGEGCAAVIAVGGGSVIDTAKLVVACLSSGLPVDMLQSAQGQAWLTGEAQADDVFFAAIPTTSGTGSESSSAALVQDDAGVKRLYRSLRTRPSAVALQPSLTLTLPRRPTAQGGFDAILHALGAYVNTDPSPIGKSVALGALRLSLDAFPRVLGALDDPQARADMQMGAYLAGVAIGLCKVDAIHGMCTPLESRLDLAHAEVLAPLFGVVARYTAETHAAPYADASRTLGLSADADDGAAATALIDHVLALARLGGLPERYVDLRLTREDATGLAKRAQQSASTPLNPRPLSVDEMTDLYLQLAA